MSPRPLRILLIEDDEIDVEVFSSMLDEAALREFSVARNGAEALTLLSASGPAPELIVLDLNTPGTDPVALLKALKADERTRRVPVVVLSGSAENEEHQRMLSAGAASFFTKPFELKEYRRRIGSILETYGHANSENG